MYVFVFQKLAEWIKGSQFIMNTSAFTTAQNSNFFRTKGNQNMGRCVSVRSTMEVEAAAIAVSSFAGLSLWWSKWWHLGEH